MTLHRIEHALVMDTDDIPGRGGYAVVGISSGVEPAERAFVAGNFGISDYLHDPRTEDRVFYSFFRVPGGRRAFVRRFSRGTELRRNNTQRRLIVHTLFLDDAVFQELYGLPWLLLNARDVLRRDVGVDHEGAVLAPLEWNTDDGAATGIAARLAKRLDNLGGRAPLVARVMSALSERTRVVLPQDSAHEWITVLAWSMLPRGDREELAWTQHDALNVAGVAFALANAVSEPPTELPLAASFATELVRMSTESEDAWRDLQERTARHPLSVRKGHELDAWLDWREALIRLRQHDLRTPEHLVVDDMRKLAATTQQNPGAPWIDGEEVLQLVWPNVPAAIAQGRDSNLAVSDWAGRLQQSGLGRVIFRAAPNARWLERAASETSADALVWFFLLGTEGDDASKATRTAIAEWIIGKHADAHLRDVTDARMARLALRLAADRSPAMPRLLDCLLETNEGLGALHHLMQDRADGGELIAAAVPIVLQRGHANTLPFLRDVFVPRIERRAVTATLAREIASVLRDEPQAFIAFLVKVMPEVAGELLDLVTQWVFRDTQRSVALGREVLRYVQRQEGAIATAGPLAIALAGAGEPAQVWLEAMLEIARATDSRYEATAKSDFLQMLNLLRERRLDVTGAMPSLMRLLVSDALRPGDATRAMILLLRPVWATGDTRFVEALVSLMERAARATAWEEIVLAYAADHARSRPRDVSTLVAAFWLKVDPAAVSQLSARTLDLLSSVTGSDRKRLSGHWSKKARALPASPASERLLHFALGERVTVAPEVQAELAMRDIDQGVADPRTLNRLDASLFKLHGKKYVDMMAAAIETYLGRGGTVSRTVTLLELLRCDEVLPTVRLVMERRVLPRAVKALTRGQWNEVREAMRDRNLVANGTAGLQLAELATRGRMQWMMRGVLGR